MVRYRLAIVGAAIAGLLLSAGLSATQAAAATHHSPNAIGDCSQFTKLGPDGYNDVYCAGSAPSEFAAYVDCLGGSGGYQNWGPWEIAGNDTDSVAGCDGNDYLTDSGYATTND